MYNLCQVRSAWLNQIASGWRESECVSLGIVGSFGANLYVFLSENIEKLIKQEHTYGNLLFELVK